MAFQRIKAHYVGLFALVLLFDLFCCAQAYAGGEWLDLGTLGGSESDAYGVSADGSVVVGNALYSNYSGLTHAFRWTETGGMIDLGTLGGSWSAAYGVSTDGSVVVGEAGVDSSASHAFRWTEAGGMIDLGTLSGRSRSIARSVSADGSVVVGYSYNVVVVFDPMGPPDYRSTDYRAFRWTQAGGMVDLGTLGGGYSWAYGVSADGSVVVGAAFDSSGFRHAFRWTQAGGMVDLGTLGGLVSDAYGVSADGSVVVGNALYSNYSGLTHAFRWTETGGMIDLGTLSGSESEAYGVSADGNVVVGMENGYYGYYHPFRWTQAGGMQTIEQWLGIPPPAVGFFWCHSVSADGKAVVGSLRNSHAFLARKTLHPSPAFLISPSGTITTNAPTYTWQAVSDSDQYCLWVNDATGNKIKRWFSAAEAGCASGAGTCAVWAETGLADGPARWWVQTWNAYGYGLWSDPLDFTVAPVNPPGKAVLTSPSGTIGTSRPTYRWNAVSNANWYWLWVNDETGCRIKQWYSAAQAGCPDHTGTCSVTPETFLEADPGSWWIQTYNESGFGPWSDGMAFVMSVPSEATLIAPSGTIGTNIPTYTWNPVFDSNWYYLCVYDGTKYRVTQWYTASQAGCPGGIGSCSVTPDVIVGGNGMWWIQTWNSIGYGPWSDAMTFTAPAASLPGKAGLVSPSGNITSNIPTYTWNPVSNSTWYYLWVEDSTGTKITKWYKASEVGCPGGTGTCSLRPDVALAQGPANWWIQTWNQKGYGPWSEALAFTAPAPVLPGKVVLGSPSETISTNKPTYTWDPDPYATWYYLWVDDSTGTKIQKWYKAADAGCPDDNGTCTVTPDVALANGSWKWWIDTWNANGSGPWSNGMTFTVSVAMGF